MKYIEFNLNRCKKNIRNNIKVIFIVIIFFIGMGTLVSFYDLNTYKEKGKSLARSENISKLDISENKKDASYYYNIVEQINNKTSFLKLYLRYFEELDLTIKSQKQLSIVNEKLRKYADDDLSILNDFYFNKPMYVTGLRDNTIAFYENKIEITEMQCKTTRDKININKDNKQLVSKLKQQLSIINEQNIKLNMLKDKLINTSQVENTNNLQTMDMLVAENLTKLNDLINTLNITMAKISKDEQYLIVYNEVLLSQSYKENRESFSDNIELDKRKTEAVAYAKSIEGIDTEKDRIIAIETFFLMLGIIVALLIGAFKNKDYD